VSSLSPEKSAVACIVDAKGGHRIVVTQRWRMHHHVAPGERAYIVPDLLVQEPVPIGGASFVIDEAVRHMRSGAAPDLVG